MGTLGSRYGPQYVPYPASIFRSKYSSLTNATRNSFLGLALSVPVSSYRCLGYVLRLHPVLVSPWRASGSGNLAEKMAQRESKFANGGRVLFENREQAAISSASIPPNEWPGRTFQTRKDGVNRKMKGDEGRRYRLAKAAKDNTRSKKMEHSCFSSLQSKKGSNGRDGEAKRLGVDSVRNKGDAREPKKKISSASVEGSGAKMGRKSKDPSPQFELRVQLDMCSKKGDVTGAISLYDSAVKEGIRLQQYHYNVLLYLCSSAAVGFVHPGKSGSNNSGSSTSNFSEFFDSNESAAEDGIGNSSKQHSDESDPLMSETEGENGECISIRVSEDVRNQALAKGFEIYESMRSQMVPMTEATLTSVARMAMATGNGDLAFDIVKQIKDQGLTVRLRSYAPALFSYCNKGEIDKAFEVERHMLDSRIQPEEPELAALLKVSIGANKGDKVYYLLHKLRANVRQVSPSTAELIEKWFRSPSASKLGKRNWNIQYIAQAIENGGGGWHGLGWLGKGKWMITRGNVDDNGVCLCCGGKLVAVDIDPAETENFAKSVVSIAARRDKNSNFQKFQKWLDYYGPFEAVIDAANVGLYSQRQFSIVKVNAIVNGVRQKLPSKKWPLIVVHNRRINDGRMNKPVNNKLIEKWKNADAVYATPTGSNDDWYWLYAAVKCKGLVVTNDEMRDHNFQVLGNDFFPKWKERHQVRFTFQNGSPEFYMPPACSTVIQESEKGDWHVPIYSEQESGTRRTWLCIRRNRSDYSCHSPKSETIKGRTHVRHLHARSPNQSVDETLPNVQHLEIVKTLKKLVAPPPKMECGTVASDLEAAERISGNVVDFQI